MTRLWHWIKLPFIVAAIVVFVVVLWLLWDDENEMA